MPDDRGPKTFALGDDEECTAIVSLKDLPFRGRREPKDRHLLVRVNGAQIGFVIRLPEQPCRIGRAQDAEVFLSDDGVSRKHARIVPENGVYVLEDTESANGTFVGGKRVERHVLRDGDLIQFGPSTVFRYALSDESGEALLRQLYEASVTDALTGARNREHFDLQLRAELSFARRHKSDVSLVLFDVDHFKRVNDTYGHPVGDQVLVELSRAVAHSLRNEDVFARYGGEEFAIILRGIDIAGARSVGERVRTLVEGLQITTDQGVLRVTVSVGCASLGGRPDMTPEMLVAAADAQLYAAKHAGRNRVMSEA
ncbi:MAG TPA: GGDEF domain-containing protein [Polyangiaceae bacterium]|nr:GGDEF domain-containing protein [Polyangiaceae bacterium]